MPKDWDKYYKQWKTKEITAVQSMEAIGIARATFYRKVKEYIANKQYIEIIGKISSGSGVIYEEKFTGTSTDRPKFV